MTGEFDVVCVGAVNLDTIVSVDRAPLEDERVTTERFLTAGGGPAATAAVTLARLGARVAFCGVVGDDPEGRVSRDLFEADGVDTRWLRVDPAAATARAIVLVPRGSGTRSIITTVAPQPRCHDVPVGKSEWLHVDQTGYAAAVEALAHGPTRTRLSIDGGNEIAGLRLSGIALYAPTLTAIRRRFAEVDAEAAVQAALAEGAAMVVATDGGRGSLAGVAGHIEHVGSYTVDMASTLGAGDVFHGALLAGLLDGRSLVGAADFAAAAAALACRGVDGRSRIPTATELETFMGTHRVGGGRPGGPV